MLTLLNLHILTFSNQVLNRQGMQASNAVVYNVQIPITLIQTRTIILPHISGTLYAQKDGIGTIGQG